MNELGLPCLCHNQVKSQETHMKNLPQNLADAVELYGQSLPEPERAKVLANLRTTLKRMILPEMNFSPYSLNSLDLTLSKMSVKLFFREANTAYFRAEEKALKAGKKPRTLKNYRSHSTRFLKWMEAQDWYQEVVQPTAIPKFAPLMRKAGVTLAQLHKGRRHSGANPYSLKEEELTPVLVAEIDSLHKFLTNEWLRQEKGDRAINEISWKGYKSCLLRFLGWLKNVNEFNVEEINIHLMADLDFLKEYINWHLGEKGNGYHQSLQMGITALNIAKWFYGKNSKFSNYSDCPQVLDIQELNRRTSKLHNTDRRTTSVAALGEKLLELEQCQEIVEYLRCCCAERTSDGSKRPVHAIIDSWQDYLIAAILTYTPVRQREIREFKIGKNLRRCQDGWWVTLSPEEHKTGSRTGKGREYPLFPCHLKERMTQDLDLYIEHWRPQANLNHDYLFFRAGSVKNPQVRGQPIPDSNYLAGLIPKLFLKISALIYGVENAKCPTPHDFRRICATWVYKYGTPEDISIYAEIMGHSTDVFLSIYQQSTSRDKTEKAEDSFLQVKAREIERKQKNIKKAIPHVASKPNIPESILNILTPQQKQKLIDQGLL